MENLNLTLNLHPLLGPKEHQIQPDEIQWEKIRIRFIEILKFQEYEVLKAIHHLKNYNK